MIESMNQIAEMWWGWMANVFWQVGIVIALVAGVDLLIRKWAWPQVRYALWLLVLVKLVLPPGLGSPMSVTSGLSDLPDKIQISRAETKPAMTAEVVDTPVVLNEAAPVFKMYDTDGQYPAMMESPVEATPVSEPVAAVETGAEQETLAVAESVSWQVVVMGIWLAGVVVLTSWLIVRGRRLGRQFGQPHGLRAHPTRAGDDIHEAVMPRWFSHMLEGTAGRIGLKRVPAVVLSSTVRSPAVYGVFRPKLLMPADKLEQLSRADVEHILLHEMSHIRRGDLIVHAISVMLTIVHWYNPLLWWVRRQLHHLRELCCDATVARLLREKTTHYRETLLEAARQLLAEPVEPGLGLLGLFEDANRLLARLKWLEKKSWKYRPLQIGAVLTVITLMSVCVLPMAQAKNESPIKDFTITERQPHIATLSNGVTVELLGVCEYHSKDKAWWRPNGTVLDTPPYDRIACSIHGEKDRQAHEAAVRVEGALESPGFRFAIPLAQSSGSSDVFKNGEQIHGMYGLAFDMPMESTQGEIRVAIAGGSWSTRSAISADLQGVIVKDGVIWHQPTLENDKVIMNTAHNISDENSRVIAICMDNTIIVAGSTSGSTHGFESIQTRFDIPLSNINEFQFQTRPYEWVTFKNVSLKPGVQTDVQIVQDRDDTQAEHQVSAKELFKDAESIFHQYTTAEPDVKKPKMAQALELYQQAYAKSPDAYTQMMIGLCYNHLGDYDAEITAYETAIETYPEKSPATYYYLGEAYHRTAQNEKAIEALKKCLALCTDRGPDAFPYSHARNLLMKLGLKPWQIDKIESPFSVVLGNGVNVDLVGLCEYPSEGKSWWKPDGSLLGFDIKTKNYSQYTSQEKGYEIAYRVHIPDTVKDVNVGWLKVKGSKQQSGLTVVEPAGIEAVRSHIDVWGRSTTVGIPIACGPWTMLGQTTGKGNISTQVSSGKLMFGPAVGTKEKLVLAVTDDMNTFDDYRLAAFDQQGQVHTAKREWFSENGLRQNTFTFSGLDPDDVDHFEFQSRSYGWVTFKKVSLKPGVQTDVQVVADDALSKREEDQPSAVLPASSLRYFVRLVAGAEGMTFEGEPVDWEGLPALLGRVPNRQETVFEFAYDSDEMAYGQVNEARQRASLLSKPFGFEYFSFIGRHPLGTKGSPAQERKEENVGITDKLKTFADERLEQAQGYYDRLVAAYEQQDWQAVDDLAKAFRDVFREYQASVSQAYQEKVKPEVHRLIVEAGELSDQLHDAVRDKKEHLIDPYYQNLGEKWRKLKEKFGSDDDTANPSEEPRGQHVAHPTMTADKYASISDNENIGSPEPVTLISHWSFDGGTNTIAVDKAGSLNGTIHGAMMVDGKIGQGLLFDSQKDYVDCGNDKRLDMHSRSFSVSAWIKTQDVHGGIISKHNGGENGEWLFGTDKGKFRFGGSQMEKSRISHHLVSDGKWHHVVGVWVHKGPDVNDVYQYIDGKLDGMNTKIRDIDSGKCPVLIGDENNRLWPFEGIIDEVIIYGEALTASQVEQLYQTGQNDKSSDKGPDTPEKVISEKSKDQIEINKGIFKSEAIRMIEFAEALAMGAPLSVKTNNGAIIVKGEDRSDCAIKATIEAEARSAERAEELARNVQVRVVPTSVGLKVFAERPKTGDSESVTVSFDIAGPSRVKGNFSSNNGKIQVDSVSGELQATSNNGKIEITGGDFTLARAFTNNGKIEAAEISGNIQFSTNNGKVEVVYAKSAAGAIKADVRTNNGKIEFRGPADLSAKVTAESDIGKVETDLPLTITGQLGKQAVGTVGSGEGNVYLKTNAGKIEIYKQ